MSGLPGAAAELAHHSLASHDVPGAFAASIRAGEEAHRLGAPAEAHQHYDQALALWDRVDGAASIAGMSRGALGLKSATAASAAGDVPRAVHLLRRIRERLAEPRADGTVGDADPELRSRVGERLANFLLQIDDSEALAEALQVAAETVGQLPAEPPTWHLARAMSTYAIAFMTAGDDASAREWAERAHAAGQRDATWVAADALVTLGQLSSREGETEEANRMFTAAFEQAAGTRMLTVELRATYFLALEQQTRGELAEAARIAQLGVRRADDEGLGLAPFGLDLRHLHFQARFLSGEWDEAQQLADGFPVRVTSLPEALLSAMALFVDVGQGQPGGRGAPNLAGTLLPRQLRHLHCPRAARRAGALGAATPTWRCRTPRRRSARTRCARTVPLRCSARPPSRWRREPTARSPPGRPGTPTPRPLSWKSPGKLLRYRPRGRPVPGPAEGRARRGRPGLAGPGRGRVPPRIRP